MLTQGWSDAVMRGTKCRTRRALGAPRDDGASYVAGEHGREEDPKLVRVREARSVLMLRTISDRYKSRE